MGFVPGRLDRPGGPKSTSKFSAGQVSFGTTREVIDASGPSSYIVPTLIEPPFPRTTTMTSPERRQFLKDVLGVLAKGTGTIVLASAATPHVLARVTGSPSTDIQKRAEALAGAAGANEHDLVVNFVNRAFVNGGGGGFRNGGFANGGGGGAFRNGGFANGGGGGFRNGAFRNW
jgi:rSAM-associated Gly-rich repeat protein